MEPNCKNKFNLDHIYCHTNDNNYIRANTGSPDVLALLKENKHLKAMLLLHLDLIQEQSDQLMTKEKLITTLREENNSLKLRLERMERRSQLRSHKNNIEILPVSSISTSAAAVTAATTVTATTAATAVVDNFEDDKKENIPGISLIEPSSALIGSTVASTVQMPNSSSTPQQQQQQLRNNKYKICDETFPNDSIIGESNGKLISKIVLQRVQIPIENSLRKFESSIIKQKSSNIEKRNNSSLSESEHQQNISIKSEPGNHDAIMDDLSSIRRHHHHHHHHHSFEHEHSDQMTDLSNQRKRKRLGFMTTKYSYRTREWEDEQQITEETNREEVEALKAEAPNLEIPKWTIKEFTGLYSIEGTEDLSDDVFLKRHAKLEHDEKRRKKWDVQRIREQRTIERLRRRHYKEELQDNQENQEIITFYPTLDQIKFIQLTDDLPVQAFGDCIPRISPTEFCLPWRESNTNVATSSISNPSTSTSSPSSGSNLLSSLSMSSSFTTQQFIDSIDSNTSSFVFLKKKRRLQSQGTPSNSKRARKIVK